MTGLSITTTITEDLSKKKRFIMLAWLLIIAGALVFVPVILLASYKKNAAAVGVLLAVNLIFTGMLFLIWNRKTFFITVGENEVGWMFREETQKKFTSPLTLAWSDIRWIRQEADQTLNFYLDNSFSYPMRFDSFSEADVKKIIEAVKERAQEKNIRLVNFSEAAAAVV